MSAATSASGFHARATCPDCKGPMSLRHNGKDRSTFLGGNAYPKCRGTIGFPKIPRAQLMHGTPKPPAAEPP